MVGIGICYALAAACEESASEKEDIEAAAVAIQRGLFFSFSIVCFPVWAIWMNAGSILKGFGVQEVHARYAAIFIQDVLKKLYPVCMAAVEEL